MKITYTELNGHRYAYTCTSRYVPGKKNPVSKRTYLGVVDPETNQIIPKKGNRFEDVALDSGFKVKSYGDVAVVLSAVASCGLAEDLEVIFGENGRNILALAVAQAIHPSSADVLIRTLHESFICESLGIDAGSFDNKTVLRTINSIRNQEVKEFFQLRERRGEGRFMVMPITMSLTEGVNDPLRGIYGSHCNDDVILCVTIDEKASPVNVRIIRNPMNNISDVVTMMTGMRERGMQCVYVSDPHTSPTLRLSQLVNNGLDFIVPYSISTTQFQMMIADSEDLFDLESYILSDGSRLKEIEVGLILDNRNGYCIGNSDIRFKDCGVHLKAFFSFDSKINDGAKIVVDSIIRNAKAELNDMPSNNPEQDLRIVAGSFSDLMRVTINKDGLMRISSRRDKIAEFKQNAGKALVITSGISWDEVLRARSNRNILLKIVNQYYSGSKWLLKNVGKNATITGQMFIEYLVMIIYSNIGETLRNHEIDDNIHDSLYLASSLKIVITPAGNIRSTVARDTKKLFAVFGIDPDNLFESGVFKHKQCYVDKQSAI